MSVCVCVFCVGGASQVVLVVKNPLANTGDLTDVDSIPGLGRFPGGGHGNPLQYSWLENPMDRGACWATVHRVAKSRTRLKWLSTHTRGCFERKITEVNCHSHHILSRVHTVIMAFLKKLFIWLCLALIGALRIFPASCGSFAAAHGLSS